jgi:AcrR family transcriptional regulator
MEVVEDRGFAATTVGMVSRRAGVSTQTFHELFGRLEDSFVAMIDDGTEIVGRVMLEAFAAESFWIDGVRSALAALLIFFDADPLRARVWQLETLAAGDWALKQRERNLALLRTLIIRRWYAGSDARAVAVASEGVMAAVLGVLHARLLASTEDEPLLALLGPLMGLAVAPFVDAKVRAREIHRGEQLACSILDGYAPSPNDAVLCRQQRRLCARATTLRATPPAATLSPRACRARQCLAFIAERPESSNREIAAGIGVTHQSQISRLLRGLADNALISNRSHGPGKRNVWKLTALGDAVARESPTAPW